jgi:hypothetical protein
MTSGFVGREGRIFLPQIKTPLKLFGGELLHTQVPKPKIPLSLHKFTFYSSHVYQYSNIIKKVL